MRFELPGLLSCFFLASGANAFAKVDFVHEVVPILKQHCIECHGGEKAKGKFSMNSRALMLDAEAAVPGKSEESLLIELITSDDSDEQMPPSKKPRLSESEIQSIRQWIDQGMDWPDEITFSDDRYEPPLKPRKPELPPSTTGTGNPIDRIVEAYFNGKAVTSRESINDSEFLRRLSLDLIGLPPSPEELLTFLLDQSGERRERIVSKLLNRKQAYAEHWMTFWNDLLRNTYSGTGFIDDGRRQITGWLYQSLLDNKPFDQFTRELIAPTPGSEGFIRGIKWRGN
ncbi:MAG TPA: DUF1549 domain-containing protein, partial [Verrucomicrobia bacterium]|nr:DUF1549 domain-containing protein [Verrucomicrobiota bacterium]